MSIKTGYLANLENYSEKETKVFVMRDRGNNELAPSKELLEAWKSGEITWKGYVDVFIEELLRSKESKKRLKSLAKEAESKDIRLICYEKNESRCHRTILKKIIDELGNDASLIDAAYDVANEVVME